MPAFNLVLDGSLHHRHHLPTAADGAPSPTARPLLRRGIDHGWIEPVAPSPDPSTADAAAVQAAWADARGILCRGAVDRQPWREAIADSLGMFERLRDGARFLDELEQRLWDDDTFRYAGSTVDRDEPREVERVFIDAVAEAPDQRRPEVVFGDLTARLSWVATDEADISLRLRFSHGHDPLGDWLADPAGRPWAAALSERVFPEARAIIGAEELMQFVADLLGGPFDCAERIVYSNAPGGGAVFHHDADPGQRGVLYTQLAGYTAWLALPRDRLAALLEQAADLAPGSGTAALAGDLDQATWEVLNTNPALTHEVWKSGGMFVLGPGDAIVLASHDADRTTWHGVFALGEHPSLAHSYGLFDRTAADPTTGP